MPDLGPLHPIAVHFVIALGVVGVGFRLLSLTPFGAWARHAATAIILMAAVAGLVAQRSGHDAHGPAERIPGARAMVQEHEEWGDRARNALVALGLVEIAGLALRRRERMARGLMLASALVGLAAVFAIYEAGEHGGELVYAYAGGVGTREGDPADVQRLLVAGLYHQARAARDSGRADEAARLTEELARQRPDDPMVGLLAAESQLKDRKDALGAQLALRALHGPEDQRPFAVRRALLLAESWVALAAPDSARAVLTAAQAKFPGVRAVEEALAKLP